MKKRKKQKVRVIVLESVECQCCIGLTFKRKKVSPMRTCALIPLHHPQSNQHSRQWESSGKVHTGHLGMGLLPPFLFRDSPVTQEVRQHVVEVVLGNTLVEIWLSTVIRESNVTAAFYGPMLVSSVSQMEH